MRDSKLVIQFVDLLIQRTDLDLLGKQPERKNSAVISGIPVVSLEEAQRRLRGETALGQPSSADIIQPVAAGRRPPPPVPSFSASPQLPPHWVEYFDEDSGHP